MTIFPYRPWVTANTLRGLGARAWLASAVLLCLASQPASAAGTAPVPEGFEPGQIERQIEQVPVPPVRPDPPALLEPARTRIELAEQAFTLAGVLVEDATVYSNLEFLELYRRWLGRAVSVRDLREIAETITRRYHEDGYFLSSALLPAQDIEFGIVRIRVIEGYVSGWRFADGASTDPLIDRMLEPVIGRSPLRRADLISVLRRVNALPDVSVTPEVHPSPTADGAYELVLTATAKRFDGALSVDNRGSDLIGPVRGVALLRAYGLAGRHESYQLRLATAAEHEELRYAEASTEWPLTAGGLHLQLTTSRIHSRPGGELEALDVRIVNDRHRLGLSWDLRLPAGEARLGAHVEAYRSRTDVLGARRLEDRLSSLALSYSGSRLLGGNALRTLKVVVSQGLTAGGSRLFDAARGEGPGEVDFTTLDVTLGYRHVVGDAWEATAFLDGQYAAGELPSAERYSIGGGRFGSAYDPSEISGDHGLAGRMEIARRPRHWVRDWRFSPYAGYDIGAVWNIAESRASRLSLASIAAGLRATGPRVSISLELARPMTRPVASDGPDRDVRAFGAFSYRF